MFDERLMKFKLKIPNCKQIFFIRVSKKCRIDEKIINVYAHINVQIKIRSVICSLSTQLTDIYINKVQIKLTE